MQKKMQSSSFWLFVSFPLFLAILLTGCGPASASVQGNATRGAIQRDAATKQPRQGATGVPIMPHTNPTPTPGSTPTPASGLTPTVPSGPVSIPPVVGANGTVYRTSVTPLAQEEFATASYTLWIPTGATTLRAVITWGPWCGGSDLGTGVPDSGTAYLGSKYHAAYLGQSLTHKDGTRNCHEAYAEKGSGAALFRALQQFASLSGHAELAQSPLVVEGMSVTAGWAVQMMKFFPDRIAAGFARGVPDNNNLVPAAASIPLMMTCGAQDPFVSGDITDFNQHRALGAPWSLAITPNEGHTWNHYTTDFETVYLDAILPLRLASTAGQLLKIDTTQGWIGDNATHQIMPVAQYTGNPLQATWLPDQNSALAWQHMVTSAKL